MAICPQDALEQGFSLLSDKTAQAFKKVVTLEIYSPKENNLIALFTKHYHVAYIELRFLLGKLVFFNFGIEGWPGYIEDTRRFYLIPFYHIQHPPNVIFLHVGQRQ